MNIPSRLTPGDIHSIQARIKFSYKKNRVYQEKLKVMDIYDIFPDQLYKIMNLDEESVYLSAKEFYGE